MTCSKTVLKALRAKAITRAEAIDLLTELAPRRKQQAGERVDETSSSLGNSVRPAIAVIGMSGRYPGADKLHAYWENLTAGRNSIKQIPEDRWDVNEYLDLSRSRLGSIYCKWLGALGDVDCFDPLFFKISPSEAEHMDPQHRLLLQEANAAFEDAGYNRQSLKGRNCGVYIGIMSNEYQMMLAENEVEIVNATGNSFSIAAGRIAYHFDLKGPALAIDTACSSSLVSIHLACQALLIGEVDMALAGGASVYLSPQSYIAMCQAGMLSEDGQCKAFDNSANGFVPGEGVGTVILKRLEDAERDGDAIYAKILGSGINHDGTTNGLTAPSASSQAALIRSVYRKIGVNPETISYCELHGTGTKLGDPVELAAITEVFRDYTQRRGFCAIGSCKGNIGHTSAAAGIASLQKVVLAMQNEALVPSLHFKIANEHFDLEASPFFVNTEFRTWNAAGGQLRRAGVSAFGISGTNAHMVVEEYPRGPSPDVNTPNDEQLVVLSAHAEEQLNEYVQLLADFLAATSHVQLCDLAYTLQIGRDAMDYRVAIVADSITRVRDSLAAFIAGDARENIVRGRNLSSSAVAKRDSLSFRTRAEKVSPHLGLRDTARAWVTGAIVDWPSMATRQIREPKRTHLPTYPFTKEHYWLPIGEATASRLGVDNDRSLRPSPTARRLTYLVKTWHPAPLSPVAALLGKVLILSTTETRSLAMRLGARFPDSEILLVDKNATPSIPVELAGVVDLTGCDDSFTAVSTLLRLVQMLVRIPKLTMLGITLGLNGFQHPNPRFAGAIQAALYRLLQNEYPRLATRHVDLDPSSEESTLTEQIISEFRATSDDAEYCYRKGIRYSAYLEEIVPEKYVKAPHLAPDQVLWITGGTGGIGLVCAKHFVKNYGVKKLFLSGREPIDRRQDAQMAAGKMANKIAAIKELEGLGAQVVTSSVLLTDFHSLEAEVKKVTFELGSIGGVIHAAGLADWSEAFFSDKPLDKIYSVFAPKVEGLKNILRIVSGRTLNIFVAFSSVAGAIPSLSVGCIDYAIANAYMDYLAQTRPSEKLVSIQWPSWKESGFGEVTSSAYKRTGLLTLSDVEGLALLDSVLATGFGPVILPAVVDPLNWRCDQMLLSSHADAPSRDNTTDTIVRRHQEVPDDLTELATAEDAAQRLLVGLFTKALKLDSKFVGLDVPFQDFGVDSISLTRVLSRAE